jgi:hypothetical protein
VEKKEQQDLELEILKTKATAFDRHTLFEKQVESSQKHIQELGGFINKISEELGVPEEDRSNAEAIIAALRDLKESVPRVVSAA